MAVAKKKTVRTIYLQHAFREVVFTSTVKADSLEEALEIGRNMNVSDVLANDPEWIDGATVITGAFES